MGKLITGVIILFAFINNNFMGITVPMTTSDRTGKIIVNDQRIKNRLEKLSLFGKTRQGGVSRLAFSDRDQKNREYIISLMREAKLKVRIDAAGNIIGRREGKSPEKPAVLFGSHIDTVPNGGKYDGPLGVIGAIECVQVLEEKRIITHHPLEVIIFVDEEGGLTGSRAFIGELTEDALKVKTNSGKTVEEGILFLGGNPKIINLAKGNVKEIRAFIEIHIEQGSVLYSKKKDIGIVQGIVGINRWDVVVKGNSNHAGTTPMNMRQDALLSAAHLVIEINRIARNMKGRQVATVGKINAKPGAANVIPGEVTMSLEIRDLSAEKIQQVFQTIKDKAFSIGERTDTTIVFTPLDVTAIPALTDETIRHKILQACKKLELKYLHMPSGAGHDAQNMARLVPTGMIFIPSVDGISHSPKEFSHLKDIVNGVNVLLHTILNIDKDR